MRLSVCEKSTFLFVKKFNLRKLTELIFYINLLINCLFIVKSHRAKHDKIKIRSFDNERNTGL